MSDGLCPFTFYVFDIGIEFLVPLIDKCGGGIAFCQ